jgi:cytochrome b
MTTLETERDVAGSVVSERRHRLVWDWPVRLFHWALVTALVGAFVTNRLGVKYFTLHVWCGYAVIVLVVFRLLWGFLGPRHARFMSFVRGPRAILGYLAAIGRGRQTRYAGHNPAGALMVLTLLALLAAQATFGLFADDEIFNAGPFAGLVSKNVSLYLTSLHRKIFYWIAAASALHVAAVLAHVWIKRDNLILAMISGKKPAHIVFPHESIGSSRSLRAIAIFAVVVAGLAFVLQFAQPSEGDISAF